ncbi:16S rRNA (adenine(1518)-N(6)/adenine(1519)-N(6))-dimethyltransferase RsmA [Anaeromassilibacillus senegalensis]|uniref:16S rRNA (adenine(1518)-N(6)/adenine(1519)-N(6))- dimethyltransferase RsmA n=1 Tax=Anaeromassilibacillus senegalensis TaxID=1673717 RepID=UPI00094035AD|nr:16S rRNA (adenine(1518)-N(6)/adenine(1519)-N(6))-dimethyltransferase RsmA [Anaeromassilibacillus senegalensis]
MQETFRLSDPSAIKALLARHGFTFSKSLGQNFLINPSVCPRMAEECGAAPGVGVLEVGPGIGVLTVELAKRAEKVVSVELDKRLLPVLEETLAPYDNVKVVNDDILKVDLKKLLREEFPGMQVVVCANLPYYITSPVIMRLLEERLPIAGLTVMVQKEAAQRLCAQPGKRECGAVSVAVQYYAEPRVLFQVLRGSFLPPPNVDSSVIRLDVRLEAAIDIPNEKKFFALVKAAFGQRRKTILNAVAAGLSVPKERIAAACDAAGIAQNARAEQMTMEQFAALSRAMESL